jgi:hypothetical protein
MIPSSGIPGEEAYELGERDQVHRVAQVDVASVRNDQEFRGIDRRATIRQAPVIACVRAVVEAPRNCP